MLVCHHNGTDADHRRRVPDLEPLRAAARSIGRNLKPGCVVVVESTVYPGVTEEVVGPIIARESGRQAGAGFHLGYSPERNSRVADIVQALRARGAHCSIFDPEADPAEIRDGYGFQVVDEPARNAPYDAVVVAVRHRVFRSMFPLEAITSLLVRERPLLIDVKALYDRTAARAAGLLYWRL